MKRKDKLREQLPLFHVLRKLSPADRVIIFSHLNDKSCDHLQDCLTKILKRKRKLPDGVQKELQRCLKEHEKDFTAILTSKSAAARRKALARVGGGPFTLLFGIGIPLLLSFFS